MRKSKSFSSVICIVLSLLMVVDFTVFQPAPAHALDKKSVVVGAAAGAVVGAGVVLAAPAVAGAVGAAGGIAGIGTAVVGGVAAVGGGLLGALGAIGGAIAAGVGAVAGWVAGIIASPLFIPALIIIAAVAVGIYLYRRHKKKTSSQEVLAGSDEIMVTPSDYDMSTVIPSMNQTGPVTIGDQDAVVISGSDAHVSDTAPVTDVTVAAPAVDSTAAAPTTTTTTTPTSTSVSNTSVTDAHARYIAAYNKYTQLVTTAGGSAAEVKAALAEYRAAYQEYIQLKQTQNLK
ncbi:MAG TPA: hypothetical protein PLU72_06300 [Candidatus Ozemobacteraceae bacterium]|nr:hypothetical protein [Candidatus Ozemobacteraceae bacterium]